MSSSEIRRRLADEQAELVRTLLGHGTPPPHFDAARLQAASTALASKRARAVMQAWPALAAALGESFPADFATYAANSTIPQRGGPLADGRAFVRFLLTEKLLSDAARTEVFWVDLQFRSCRDGLKPRSGIWLGVALLHGSQRILLGVRFPGIGARCVTLRVGRAFAILGGGVHSRARQQTC